MNFLKVAVLGLVLPLQAFALPGVPKSFVFLNSFFERVVVTLDAFDAVTELQISSCSGNKAIYRIANPNFKVVIGTETFISSSFYDNAVTVEGPQACTLPPNVSNITAIELNLENRDFMNGHGIEIAWTDKGATLHVPSTKQNFEGSELQYY